jgi:hypothetical protein
MMVMMNVMMVAVATKMMLMTMMNDVDGGDG